MGDNEACVFYRRFVPLEDLERFKLSSNDSRQRFSNIYAARLAALKRDITRRATKKWEEHQVLNICDLATAKRNEFFIIVGTLYKHQELKPSILSDLSKELQLTTQPSRANYASFKDILFLEDETLRVRLVGDRTNIQEIVTGIVCAVLGQELDDGTFQAKDWCFPGFCSKPVSNVSSRTDGKILIISGLALTNNTQLLSLNLLSEWICGMAGDSQIQEEEASIVGVVIAGNSVRGSIETFDRQNYFERKANEKKVAKETTTDAHRLDAFLERIVRCCRVILMPGEFDPASHTIPQQPIHPCLLPETTRFRSFHGVTNPWIGCIGSRIVAGSSGQPILDIMKVSGLVESSPLEWLERTLHWRHFAPTAPDTLLTNPYLQSDPFVMKECPNIYFVGNMEDYDTKLVTEEEQTVRLISIPKFSKTLTAVLIDLDNLESSPISFGYID